MWIIIFLRITNLSFQKHQTRILSVGLGMAWNRYGLSCITYAYRNNVHCFFGLPKLKIIYRKYCFQKYLLKVCDKISEHDIVSAALYLIFTDFSFPEIHSRKYLLFSLSAIFSDLPRFNKKKYVIIEMRYLLDNWIIIAFV